MHLYDVTRGLRKNGTFLLNTIWQGEELAKNLPTRVKKYFAKNNITVYYINATQIAQEIGLGNRTNTILQSAFFRITGVIPVDLAVEQMKKFIVKSYGKKGEDVVNKNYAAVDRGGEYQQLTVDPSWVNLSDDAKVENNDPAFINEVVRPINAQDGDLLPVSAFKGIEDGTWGSDVSEQGFTRDGVAVVPDANRGAEITGSDMAHWTGMPAEEKRKELTSKPLPEINVTQELRQEGFDNWETTDDHAVSQDRSNILPVCRKVELSFPSTMMRMRLSILLQTM